MIKDYFLLALSNLKHRGIRSWLTMLGIFIGIAAVVSLISLGNGLQTAVTGQFSTLGTDKLVVQNAGTGFGPPGSTAIRKLTEHDVKVIENVQGVKEIVSRLLRVVKMEYNKQEIFAYAASLPKEKKQIDLVYETIGVKPESGRLLDENDKGKVVLGHDFSVKELFGKQIQVGTKLIIQKETFEVVGILKAASSFTINSVVLMSEDDMKSVLKINDEIDIIAVQVYDKDQAEQVAEDISRALRKDRNEKVGEEDFSVQTPVQTLGAINTVLNVINLVVSGIAAISLLIGGIGIANTMYTSVLERTREIGVMKAVGAQNKDVLYIFIIESGLLGLVGGIVGAIIGLALAFAVSGAANQAFGERIIDVMISYPLLLGAIAFSFVLGLASGILPAFQAFKLKPTEALRG